MADTEKINPKSTAMLKAQYKMSGIDADNLDKEIMAFITKGRRSARYDRKQLCGELRTLMEHMEADEMCTVEVQCKELRKHIFIDTVRNYAGIISDALPGEREVWSAGDKLYMWRTE